MKNIVKYNLIGAHITTYHTDGTPAHSGVILGDGMDIKMKLNATHITHSNSKKKIGWVQGDEDITGSLTAPKDQAILDVIIQDCRNGALATIAGVGKVTEAGQSNPIYRLDGVIFTEYDNKYAGKKETVVAVNFEAINFTKIKPQLNV